MAETVGVKREQGECVGEAAVRGAPGAARQGSYICEVESEADEELSAAALDAREKIRTGRYAIDLSELAEVLVEPLGSDDE